MAASLSSTGAQAALEQWALPRMQQLLPLDEESLRQVLQYTTALSKSDAAEHLKNLLGDDAKALEFIASFNLRRGDVGTSNNNQESGQGQQQPVAAANTPSSGSSPADRSRAGGRGGRGGKKKPNIHALPARQVEGHGDLSGAYVKSRDESDYMPRSGRQQHKATAADNLALRHAPPDATQMPLITDNASATSKPITSKAPPSAAGPLMSDTLAPKKATSAQSSRNQSPMPKAKVSLSGGAQMRGASSALSDLDSAIRSLEMQTNPSLSSSLTAAEQEHRQCNCMATRHPLLDIAPNCLSCGKVICVKQGLGPCTFCATPLLTSDEIHKVLRVLKEERGEEKTAFNNAAHKRADVSQGKLRAFTGREFLSAHSAASPSPLSASPATSDDEASSKAQAHRDKLLSFQAQNARRTQIHDEAADYDIPTSGTNMWASPAERAQQLKRQQRVLREMEWNARPEWEKRKVVASIDLKGGKVVRRMAEVERPDFGAGTHGEGENQDDAAVTVDATRTAGAGAFSQNPLAKGLIRPLARDGAGGKGKASQDMERREKRSQWRRVQMDEDDNEQWILDGGVYGGREPELASLATEEPECG